MLIALGTLYARLVPAELRVTLTGGAFITSDGPSDIVTKQPPVPSALYRTMATDLTVLTLTPDNVKNCTITDALGVLVYSVATEYTGKATFTRVRNAKDEIIATLEWRDVLSDKVTIGDRKPMSLGDWMKKSLIPYKEYVAPKTRAE